MKPLDLKEFAEKLYLQGDNVEFATEILKLLEFQAEKEPLLDWLTDRSNIVNETRDILTNAGFDPDTDIDDAVRELIDSRDVFEDILQRSGFWTEGDVFDALHLLIKKAKYVPETFDL